MEEATPQDAALEPTPTATEAPEEYKKASKSKREKSQRKNAEPVATDEDRQTAGAAADGDASTSKRQPKSSKKGAEKGSQK